MRSPRIVTVRPLGVMLVWLIASFITPQGIRADEHFIDALFLINVDFGAGASTTKAGPAAQLQRICGVDLTRVVGFNVLSVLILFSEIGVDMSRWPNAKAFCAWLGLCPANKISGGKVLSSRTARAVNRVAILLRTLAPTLGRTDTWLGVFHRRMKARIGPAAANTATARKLATILYHLLKYKEEYLDVDRVVYEAKFRRYRLSRLRRQANELGCQIVELKQAA